LGVGLFTAVGIGHVLNVADGSWQARLVSSLIFGFPVLGIALCYLLARQGMGRSCTSVNPTIPKVGDASVREFWFSNGEYAQSFINRNPGAQVLGRRTSIR